VLYKKMLAVAVVAACAGLSGCENTARGLKQDAKENKAAAEKAGGDTKAATADERAAAKQDGREAGAAVGNAAERAGDAVAGAVKDAGASIHAGKQTLDVKTALQADTTIDASRIDVDTDESTKTVTLKGSVATAAQKATAGRIAKDKAEGYTVKNLLTVSR
jgi:predicted small secreted protein